MAPTVRTAEYILLTAIRDAVDLRLYDKRNVLRVNDKALVDAVRAGYVECEEGYAHLTNDGVDRLDKLED